MTPEQIKNAETEIRNDKNLPDDRALGRSCRAGASEHGRESGRTAVIPPEINDYGGAPFATHNHACSVCLTRPSVLNLSTGRLEPCWTCQKKGWRLTRMSCFWRWLFGGTA